MILRKPCGQPTDHVAGFLKPLIQKGLFSSECGKYHGIFVTSSLGALYRERPERTFRLRANWGKKRPD